MILIGIQMDRCVRAAIGVAITMKTIRVIVILISLRRLNVLVQNLLKASQNHQSMTTIRDEDLPPREKRLLVKELKRRLKILSDTRKQYRINK